MNTEINLKLYCTHFFTVLPNWALPHCFNLCAVFLLVYSAYMNQNGMCCPNKNVEDHVRMIVIVLKIQIFDNIIESFEYQNFVYCATEVCKSPATSGLQPLTLQIKYK